MKYAEIQQIAIAMCYAADIDPYDIVLDENGQQVSRWQLELTLVKKIVEVVEQMELLR